MLRICTPGRCAHLCVEAKLIVHMAWARLTSGNGFATYRGPGGLNFCRDADRLSGQSICAIAACHAQEAALQLARAAHRGSPTAELLAVAKAAAKAKGKSKGKGKAKAATTQERRRARSIVALQ